MLTNRIILSDDLRASRFSYNTQAPCHRAVVKKLVRQAIIIAVILSLLYCTNFTVCYKKLSFSEYAH